MGHTCKFFGFYISYTILNLPMSTLYLVLCLFFLRKIEYYANQKVIFNISLNGGHYFFFWIHIIDLCQWKSDIVKMQATSKGWNEHLLFAFLCVHSLMGLHGRNTLSSKREHNVHHWSSPQSTSQPIFLPLTFLTDFIFRAVLCTHTPSHRHVRNTVITQSP